MAEESKQEPKRIQQQFDFYTKEEQERVGRWIVTKNKWKNIELKTYGDCLETPTAACICNKPSVKRKRRFQPTACTCPKKSYQYTNPIPGKSQSKLRINQAVFIWTKGYIPVNTDGITDDERLQVSHICGRTLCCNPNHLVLEKQRVNNDRIECHDNLKDEEAHYKCEKCEHVPKCIYNS